MKHTLNIFLVLAAVVAWAIDGSTPRADGGAFSVDRDTAGTVGTSVWDRSASGGKADSHKGCPYENSLNLRGRSAEDFLTPEGRFDLKAIRASGYEGPLDLKGLDVGIEPGTGEPVLSPSASTKRVEGKGTLDQQVGFDVGIEPHSGEPVLSPVANARIYSHPDDTFWTDKFSCAAGLGGMCYALCVYDGKLIAGGYFHVAGCTLAAYIASWDGSSWSPLGSGMNDDVRALTVYDTKLIAGGYFTTAGGVSAYYIASWDGSSWSPLGSGMNNYVQALAVYDNKLIAGGLFTTAGGKVSAYIAQWTKQYDGDVDDGDNEWSLPPDFRLEQNYPNPFNPATTIEYSLPKRGHVKIEIFNLVGQKVRTLVDEYKLAGNYCITWDGTDTSGNPLASGIYFCRLRAGDHVQAKKMLLIK